MKNSLFFISIILLVCTFEAHAHRSMYVDGFPSILGDPVAEDELLSYAQSNQIETLLLYGLHVVNANHNLANPETNYILADFISKAKTQFGIVNMGATAENGNFFTNVIDAYNNSRSNPNEKFDIYNLEFEFWNVTGQGSNGYYCTTYLVPNGLPCTNAGGFQFFISTLQTMNNLASNNSHPISVEAYVGWPTAGQLDTIGSNLDRLRLHAYVSNPNTAFSYVDFRLFNYANSHPGADVSIIFSSEPTFMHDWLLNNSMSAAENIFIEDWLYWTSNWSNNINLEGFTYFTYSYNIDIILSTNNFISSESLSIYPNPVKNILSIKNIDNLKNVRIYDVMGSIILETKEEEIDVSYLAKGIYLLQIQTDKYIETKRIIKEF